MRFRATLRTNTQQRLKTVSVKEVSWTGCCRSDFQSKDHAAAACSVEAVDHRAVSESGRLRDLAVGGAQRLQLEQLSV